jgi:GMP synthase-like glutamine amidotransferase
MILIVNICRYNLHYFEFVKPIEDVLTKNNVEFETISYKELQPELISKADKVIISGTSLKDNNFSENLNFFKWIKDFEKPVLGICGGMQILGLIYNGKYRKQQEIGLTKVDFKKEFLGLKEKVDAYELHNYFVESDEFEIFAESKNCHQAFKHKTRLFYGVLFHPEVRNKKLLVEFAEL